MTYEPWNFTRLNENELKVVFALQSEPMASYGRLAKLTGFSKPGVYKILKRIREDKKSFEFRVSGRYNDIELGLKHIDVLVSAEGKKRRRIVKKIIADYPYLILGMKCNGYLNGWLLQFKIPYDRLEYLEEFLISLKKRDFINNYIMFPYDPDPVYTEQQVSYWDTPSLSWKFNFKDWFALESIAVENSLVSGGKKKDGGVEINNPVMLIGGVKKWLTKDSIEILGELNHDARMTPEQMEHHLLTGRNPSIKINADEIKKQLKKLNKQCISRYRVIFNSSSFDILNTVILWGEGDPRKISNLRNRLLQTPIPFTSNLKIYENQFFWYINAPSRLLSQLSYYLEDFIDTPRLVTLEHSRGKEFYIDPDNWNGENNEWIQSHEYIVDKPIKNLEEFWNREI